jgi:hypothetical protein
MPHFAAAHSCTSSQTVHLKYRDHIGPRKIHTHTRKKKLDDGWPESEKDVFQAALSMVVVKIVGEWLVDFL